MYSNKENIIQDHIYLYFNLIYFHFIPIIISLFFYFIFSCAFTKNEENKSEICLTRFCGYLIFKEEKERKKSITCAGCRIGFRKCYKSNMCCCCVCKCLECESCCCKEKDDLTEINDRDKAICICYKLSGKCSWICEYFSNNYIMLGVWVITIFEVFNFGFKSLLADYIKELDYQRNYSNPEIKENIFTIHIVFLIGIIFCYLFNLISGSIFYKKCDFKRFVIKGEDTILGTGETVLCILENLISCVFSALIYYEVLDDYKYYLMAFSISSVEYIKVYNVNLLYKFSYSEEQLFASASFISILLTIVNAIFTLLDYLITDHMGFVFFQFILTAIISSFFFCFMCMGFCYLLCGKKLEEIEKAQKEEGEKLKEELKKNEEEIRKMQALIDLYEILKLEEKKEEEKLKKENEDE